MFAFKQVLNYTTTYKQQYLTYEIFYSTQKKYSLRFNMLYIFKVTILNG